MYHSFHSLFAEGYLVCFQSLAIMNGAAMYRFLCDHSFSLLQDESPGMLGLIAGSFGKW